MTKFAVSFIAGIAAFNFYTFFPVTITVLFLAVLLLLFSRYRTNKKIVFIMAAAFAFSIFHASTRHVDMPAPALPLHDVIVEGIIVGVPEVTAERIRFDVDEVSIEGIKIIGRVRLNIYKDKFANDINGYDYPPDAKIAALARLKEPGSLRNPGVFVYNLKRQGIVATGYVKKMWLLSTGSGVMNRINLKRQRLAEIIDNSLSRDSASLHKAIITGFKGDISLETRDSFNNAGLAHLLSISGTHFGLLAFIIFQAVKTVLKHIPLRVFRRMTLFITPSQLAVLATIPVILLYLFISGTSIPAVRSFIMVFVYMCAIFLGRKGQWLNSLSIAAVIILLWDPDTLFDISFILSFLAVLSIGYVLEKILANRENDILSSMTLPMDREVSRGEAFIEKMKTAPLLTVAAVLGTAPIVAVLFKHFPLISPLTNLIVTPLVCFVVLPLGFFTGFFAIIVDMPVMPLSGLTDLISGLALWLIKHLAGIPYSSIHVPAPSLIEVIIYYMSLMLIVRSSGKSRWGLALFVIVLFFYVASPYMQRNKFSVTFLDVGQGDAAVVDLPDGKVMLIDGSTGNPDMGRRVIAHYLWARGVRRIDYVVVSHLHPDHYGGLIYIFNHFDAGEIWLNGRILADAAHLKELIMRKKVKMRSLVRGHVLETQDYKITVLHPYNEFYSASTRGVHSDENNDSLVLKIDSENGSILFTGDIEEEAEYNLFSLGSWLNSDILKVPHHGSRTSSTRDFINSVSPRLAVVSAGRNNAFGHPHDVIVDRYSVGGVPLFRTDMHGAVTVTIKDGMFLVKTAEDRRLRKVVKWRDEVRNLGLLFIDI